VRAAARPFGWHTKARSAHRTQDRNHVLGRGADRLLGRVDLPIARPCQSALAASQTGFLGGELVRGAVLMATARRQRGFLGGKFMGGSLFMGRTPATTGQ